MAAELSFGGLAKRRRLDLGLTQKELARLVGCAVVTLRKVEAGELRLSGQMARRLAEALEVPLEDQPRFVHLAREQALPLTSAALPPTKPKHGLPALTTALIGREQELAELARLLAEPDIRLITILSAGGMGKTSLAIAAARLQADQFAHGACWVELAPLTTVDELVLMIVASLGLQLYGPADPLQQVGDFLRTRHLLLVLDNFEHLLAGASQISELLTLAPKLTVLVTSRQRLNLSCETVFLLDGLPFPPANAPNVQDYAAVQLLLLHARHVRPHYQPDAHDLADIAEISRFVHGMPLGILLAAAWLRALSPAEIAAEIGRDVGFLHAEMIDIPARQRDLRTIFQHTWDRLPAAACDAFMRLSVFRGGATVEAFRQVTGASMDTMAGLIDKALLRRLSSGRLEVHELLRQFAMEKLAANNSEGTGAQRNAEQRHSRYYLTLLSRQASMLLGSEQRVALDTIHADFENISVAWHRAVQEREFAELIPAVQPLFLYCDVRGALRAGVTLFGAAANMVNTVPMGDSRHLQTAQMLKSMVFLRLGACEVLSGNYARGEQLLLDGAALSPQETERAFALAYLGQAAIERGDLPLAQIRLRESVAISEKCNDFATSAYVVQLLEIGTSIAEAQQLAMQSLAFARKSGRPDLIATRVTHLGWHTWCLGDYAPAEALWHEGLELCSQLGLRGEDAWPLDCLGFAAWFRGDLAVAERYIEAALAIYADVGRPSHIGMCMSELALVWSSLGHTQKALASARQAVAVTRKANAEMMHIVSLNHLGAVLLAADEFGEARHTLCQSVARAWDHKFLFSVMVGFYFSALLLMRTTRTADLQDGLASKACAVALLNCVRTHPSAWQAYRDKAAQFQAQLAEELPATVFAAAMQKGETATVPALVSMLLGILSTGKSPAAVLPRDLAADAAAQAVASGEWVGSLTLREAEVLQLIAAGRSNYEIAAELVVTPGTAKWYVSQVLSKLHVHSRTQAIARGRELGLLAR